MPKFDPDSALKKDLQVHYERLDRRFKSLNRRFQKLKATAAEPEIELLEQLEAAKKAADGEVHEDAVSAQAALNARIDQLETELRGSEQRLARRDSEMSLKDQEIVGLKQQLEGLLDTDKPRSLVIVVLKPGLNHYQPSVDLFVTLIIENETKHWVGINTCGYGRDNESTTGIYPFLLKGDHLDYGEAYEGERDGLMLIKGRRIEKGTTIPFFPDGAVNSTGKDVYLIDRVLPVMHGHSA